MCYQFWFISNISFCCYSESHFVANLLSKMSFPPSVVSTSESSNPMVDYRPCWRRRICYWIRKIGEQIKLLQMQQRCRTKRTEVCVVAPSLRHDQIRDRIAVVRDGHGRAFLTSPWRGEERRIFGPMSCFPCLPSYPLWRPRKKANKIGHLTPAYPSLKSKMHMTSHAHLKDNRTSWRRRTEKVAVLARNSSVLHIIRIRSFGQGQK